MSPERMPPVARKSRYREHLEKIVAGRSVDVMQAELAEALHEANPTLFRASFVELLSRVKTQRVVSEGPRTRPVEEIYAVIFAALRLRARSGNKPTIDDLAREIQMDRFQLERLVRGKSLPKELRESILEKARARGGNPRGSE